MSQFRLNFTLVLFLISICSFAQGKHYFSLGIDPVTSGAFKDVDDGSSSVDIDFDFESAISFGYEYQTTSPDSWGSAFGVRYHSKRDVSEINYGGVTSSSISDPGSVSALILHANFIYRWDVFYIPFGLAFSSLDYSPPSSFSGSVDSTGGFGLNFKLGWNINESLQIEYGATSTTWKLSSDTVDYGTGTFAVSTLALKYSFM